MPSAQDPFYIVKQEIQESIDKLQSTFPQWEKTANAGEQSNLSKKPLEILLGMALMEWRLKTGGSGPVMLVSTTKKAVQAGKGLNN
ncbi:hypothetical protein JHK84_028069 [Glycine max]|nr:hypothetical protein JHK85_028485 [Glycine max]KAG5003816.1 hypothetical protein JHK86_027955 [Glycine max]KAG5151597.1 hypothetical protein JHK84_028069 [Glycine max]